MTDSESNRITRRIARYARVGAGVGGAAARFGDPRNAAALVSTLGGLKGPLMKVAQMMATIPDLLPGDFAAELQKLQAEAPPMGPAFVRRRMMAELGPDWESRFAAFDKTPAAAASLGQVHRARAHDGRALAVKLQYPDMKSAVEADLSPLGIIMSLQRRFSPEVDTTEIAKEVGERLREELDYGREARHMTLYGAMLKNSARVTVPEALPELSTERLLAMTWLDGQKLLGFIDHPLAERNAIAMALFEAWWQPFASHGVIHGDPHLGNYSVRTADGRPDGINLLDFGCVRIFPPVFVDGVVGLYHALKREDREAIVAAFEAWGFRGLNRETIDTLTIWARFIYAPLLDDRVRTIADGVAPQNYGRKEVWEVKQRLKPQHRITIPREFVMMDRAAIGLGSVMLHLKAELNFHRLFESMIADFDAAALGRRQAAALKAAGLG
jgi:predicted unusual protein kinase regulating ubiquinone biosynthesis (AarF/ABC1/UbiB family)